MSSVKVFHCAGVRGLEIFDDWLVRHIERLDSLIRFRDEGWNRTSGAFRSCDIPIEVVLEAPIPADEVELHVEAACRLPPWLAPSTVQSLGTTTS